MVSDIPVDITEDATHRDWLLSTTMLTGRDAAHRRMIELCRIGQGLPEGVDLRGNLIYYVYPASGREGE